MVRLLYALSTIDRRTIEKAINLIFQEGAIDALLKTLLNPKSEESTKLYSLLILGNLGLHGKKNRMN